MAGTGAKLVDLAVQKCFWVTTLANETAPTSTEVSGGVDLSCLLTPDYSVDTADSDTVSEKALCETANSQTPTVGNYEGNLVLFRKFDSSGIADTDDPLAAFPADSSYPVGYFFRRVGPPQTQVVAASDVFSWYKFRADNAKTKGGTNEGYIKMSVKLLPQGFFKVGVALAT